MDKITFQYITLDIAEKILRLRNYILFNSSKTNNNSNSTVIMVYEESINKIISSLDELICRINIINKKSTKDEIFAIQRSLSCCYTAIKELHKELHYLSSDWLKPETYTFIEQIFNDNFNPNKKNKISIILTDEYTFIETNLNKQFKKIIDSFYSNSLEILSGENPTVILPKIEYSNPLNWPILVHELGHTEVDKIEKLCSTQYFKSLKNGEKETDKFKNWAEEIYCDIRAIKVIGPAYFLSLATFAIQESLMTGLGVSTNSHPPFKIRLALLHSFIDNHIDEIDSKLPNNTYGSIQKFIYEMTTVINTNICSFNPTLEREPSSSGLMEFFLNLRAELVEEENQKVIINSIRPLVTKLSEFIPIGSYRDRGKDEDYLKELKRSNIKTEKFNVLKNSLTERKTDLLEIINAGWIYKFEQIIPSGINIIFNNTEKRELKENIKIYGEKLELLDNRLLVSIEISKLIDLVEN